MLPRNALFILVCLIAITASAVAIQQRILLQELYGSFQECEQSRSALQGQVAQLEVNLHSAGRQMNNLSDIIQEATQRAARCNQ